MPLSHHAYYNHHAAAHTQHDRHPHDRYPTRAPAGVSTPRLQGYGQPLSPTHTHAHSAQAVNTANAPPARASGGYTSSTATGGYDTKNNTTARTAMAWESRMGGHQTPQAQTPQAAADRYAAHLASPRDRYTGARLSAADRAMDRVEELLAEREQQRVADNQSSPVFQSGANRGRVASPPAPASSVRLASNRMSRSPGREYTAMTPPKRVFSTPAGGRDYEAYDSHSKVYGHSNPNGSTSSLSDATNLSMSSNEAPATPPTQHLARGRREQESPHTPSLRSRAEDVYSRTPVSMRHAGATTPRGGSIPSYNPRPAVALLPPKEDVNENGERRASMLWDGMSQFIIAPQAPEDAGKYCVVLDLDETLVYAREGPIKVRPYMRELIQVLGEHFETVVWTAGERSYAKEVLRKIDPISAIRHCIYRHHLWFDGQAGQVKDLRLLGRDPDRVLLVENTPDCLRKNATQSVLLPDFRGTDDQGILQKLSQFLTGLVRSGQPVAHFLRQSPLITPREVSTNVGDTIICHTVGESDSNFAHRAPNPDTLPSYKSPKKY
eukprot:TRINITY_DN24826_c0_g1_i1.p1 TRINITY_DN24826_c0_g1~~TRINITY_DN24826_c0_g1_i1.p1  ORF type:complete len:551 (+),score=176.44 TRINITY_DN24826_c0_g1_i1:78-1730(+)